MNKKNQKELVEKVLVLLDKPKEWAVEDYETGDTFRLRHKATDISIWMCNGYWFCRIESPFNIRLSFLDKWKIWKKALPIFNKLSAVQKYKADIAINRKMNLLLKDLNKK